MKFAKRFALLLVLIYFVSGLQFSITKYYPILKQSSQGQVNSDLDSKVKEKAEAAAVIFVHTVFGPFERISDDVAKRHPELHTNDNEPLILDETWLQIPDMNVPPVEETLKPLADKAKEIQN